MTYIVISDFKAMHVRKFIYLYPGLNKNRFDFNKINVQTDPYFALCKSAEKFSNTVEIFTNIKFYLMVPVNLD